MKFWSHNLSSCVKLLLTISKFLQIFWFRNWRSFLVKKWEVFVEEQGIEESYFFLDEALKCCKAFSSMIIFMEKKIFLTLLSSVATKSSSLSHSRTLRSKFTRTLIFFLCSLLTCWLKVFNDCHIWSLHNLTESPGWLSLLKKVRQKVQLKQDVKLRLEWWGWLRKLFKWTFQDRRWNLSSDVEVGVVSKFWLPICDLAMGWRTNWIKKSTGNVVFTENVVMCNYQLHFFSMSSLFKKSNLDKQSDMITKSSG